MLISKKFFLLFLSLSILKPAYAMKRTTEDTNDLTPDTFINALITNVGKNHSEKDWQNLLQKYLEKDPNIINSAIVSENKEIASAVPLLIAIEYSDEGLLNYLLAQKADPNNTTHKHCFIENIPLLFVPIHKLVTSTESFYVNTVEKLLKYGANLEVEFGNKTALTYAIESQNEPVVDLLIKYNADINKKGRNNPLWNSLRYAFLLPMIEKVCRAGASLDDITDHDNAFHETAFRALPNECFEALVIYSRFDFPDDNDTNDPLVYTNKHIQKLQELLIFKSGYGGDASKTVALRLGYFNKKLQEDSNAFDKEFPNTEKLSQKNLKLRIYENRKNH